VDLNATKQKRKASTNPSSFLWKVSQGNHRFDEECSQKDILNTPHMTITEKLSFANNVQGNHSLLCFLPKSSPLSFHDSQ